MVQKPLGQPDSLTILRLAEVRHVTGLSRSTIYLRIKLGTFPTPISLGGRAIGFLQHEIQAWLQHQVHASRGTTPADAE